MALTAAQPTNDDFRLPRRRRVRSRRDFQRIFGGKRTVARDATLMAFGKRNDLGETRLGVSVSKKLGGAVRRNRWKRLLREAFRLERRGLPVGIDVVIIPQQAEPPPLSELRRGLVSVVRRMVKRLPPPEDVA